MVLRKKMQRSLLKLRSTDLAIQGCTLDEEQGEVQLACGGAAHLGEHEHLIWVLIGERDQLVSVEGCRVIQVLAHTVMHQRPQVLEQRVSGHRLWQTCPHAAQAVLVR